MTSDLTDLIRTIPDFPKPGILFRDITPILNDSALFRVAIAEFVRGCRAVKAEKIAGIDARGVGDDIAQLQVKPGDAWIDLHLLERGIFSDPFLGPLLEYCQCLGVRVFIRRNPIFLCSRPGRR